MEILQHITNNQSTADNLNKISPLNYSFSAFKQSFTNSTVKNTTTYEIEKNY